MELTNKQINDRLDKRNLINILTEFTQYIRGIKMYTKYSANNRLDLLRLDFEYIRKAIKLIDKLSNATYQEDGMCYLGSVYKDIERELNKEENNL